VENVFRKNDGLSTRLRGADFSYRYFHQCFIILFLALMIAVMSLVSDTFRTAYNYGNVINSSFTLIMAALGQFLVILTAGIDISITGMIALTNCLSVYIMTNDNTPSGMVFSIIATLATGILCGALNGFFIAVLRLPAIIVTIATSTIFLGCSLILMPMPCGTVYSAFSKFLRWKAGGVVPISLFLTILFVALLVILTNKTTFGKSLRAIGGNESAAYGTGVRVMRTKFLAYMLCGLLCSIGGLYLSARTSCGDPNAGSTYTVYSISAAVVGGTLMSGAVGEAYGVACGAVIIYLINNILNMLNVQAFYQFACQGAVLIFALMIGSFETRRRSM